jgi:hypothetical protein
MPKFKLGMITSGTRQVESKVAPNTKGPNTSRFRSAFEILSMGLLGCPMEAIKNLIPKGLFGGAGAASPKRIA